MEGASRISYSLTPYHAHPGHRESVAASPQAGRGHSEALPQPGRPETAGAAAGAADAVEEEELDSFIINVSEDGGCSEPGGMERHPEHHQTHSPLELAGSLLLFMFAAETASANHLN